MQADFKFSSLIGQLYTGGNVCFAPDGRSLISAVNSYLTSIDLHQGNSNRSHAASNSMIQCFDITRDGDLALVVGTRGLAFFYSLSAQVVLDTISLPPNATIGAVRFSPCGKYVALGLETTLQVYAAPAQRTVSFHSCHRIENIHSALTLNITHIDWSADSNHVLIAGQDARMKIYPRQLITKLQMKGFAKSANTLIGHRGAVLGAFFMGDNFTGQHVGVNSEESFFEDATGGAGGAASSSSAAAAAEKAKKPEIEDPDTSMVVSISHDNAVIVWERSSMTRREVMAAIAQTQYSAKVFKGGKNGKKGGAKRSGDDDDNADDEENEDDFDEEEDEEEDAHDSEEEIPETFIERQKRGDRLDSGVSVSTAYDKHLPICLRNNYNIKSRHLLQHKGNVTVADYHKGRGLLVIGYDSGIFAIHGAATADCALVHLLSITAQSLTACRFSPSGDHVAFGSSHLKQLLVWDWKGEAYVLKEQSHYYDIACTAMTADGQCIISGGDDGKLKVWRAGSGQCFVTFTEHAGGITGIATSNSTNAFFSASKDGTVRAYDLVRYRNFRVFTPPERTQLSCIAVDPSGEVLAVGSSRHSRITLFSVQTGRVIDELQGHEGPTTCLAFHPNGTTLVSGSIDKSLIVWDIFGGSSGGVEAGAGDRLIGEGEVVQQTSEVLSVAYSHNGRRMAMLTMSGEITVFDTVIANQPQVIVSFGTKFDATGGWSTKNVGPNSANSNARFTTVSFSPQGDKVVAGGESKWIVLYHATQGYVMKKWPVTTNLDVEGSEEQFKWRVQSEAGNVNDIDVSTDDIHLRARNLIEMPGSKARHFATGKRKTELTARTMHITFAAHGRDFVAATTDGLLVYSLDVHRPRFVPLQLQRDLTGETVRRLIAEKQYVQAIIGALMLQDPFLGMEAMRLCPDDAIAVAVGACPTAAFVTLVQWVSAEVESSPFIQKALLWAQAIVLFSNEPMFGTSGGALVNNVHRFEITAEANREANVKPLSIAGAGGEDTSITPALKMLHRALQRHTALKTLAHDNLFTLKFIKAQSR